MKSFLLLICLIGLEAAFPTSIISSTSNSNDTSTTTIKPKMRREATTTTTTEAPKTIKIELPKQKTRREASDINPMPMDSPIHSIRSDEMKVEAEAIEMKDEKMCDKKFPKDTRGVEDEEKKNIDYMGKKEKDPITVEDIDDRIAKFFKSGKYGNFGFGYPGFGAGFGASYGAGYPVRNYQGYYGYQTPFWGHLGGYPFF